MDRDMHRCAALSMTVVFAGCGIGNRPGADRATDCPEPVALVEGRVEDVAGDPRIDFALVEVVERFDGSWSGPLRTASEELPAIVSLGTEWSAALLDDECGQWARLSGTVAVELGSERFPAAPLLVDVRAEDDIYLRPTLIPVAPATAAWIPDDVTELTIEGRHQRECWELTLGWGNRPASGSQWLGDLSGCARL